MAYYTIPYCLMEAIISFHMAVYPLPRKNLPSFFSFEFFREAIPEVGHSILGNYANTPEKFFIIMNIHGQFTAE